MMATIQDLAGRVSDVFTFHGSPGKVPELGVIGPGVCAIRLEEPPASAQRVVCEIYLPDGVAVTSLWVGSLPYDSDTKRKVREDRSDGELYWDTFARPWKEVRVRDGQTRLSVVFADEPAGDRIYAASVKGAALPRQADGQSALVVFSQPVRLPRPPRGASAAAPAARFLGKAECYERTRNQATVRLLRSKAPDTRWEKHVLNFDAEPPALAPPPAATRSERAPASSKRRRSSTTERDRDAAVLFEAAALADEDEAEDDVAAVPALKALTRTLTRGTFQHHDVRQGDDSCVPAAAVDEDDEEEEEEDGDGAKRRRRSGGAGRAAARAARTAAQEGWAAGDMSHVKRSGHVFRFRVDHLTNKHIKVGLKKLNQSVLPEDERQEGAEAWVAAVSVQRLTESGAKTGEAPFVPVRVNVQWQGRHAVRFILVRSNPPAPSSDDDECCCELPSACSQKGVGLVRRRRRWRAS